jgi:hypothetical protein
MGWVGTVSLPFPSLPLNLLVTFGWDWMVVEGDGANKLVVIDTAVNYQFGESEQWIGEWMAKHNRRDEMVIATKFTGRQLAHVSDKVPQQGNFGGNSAKNIHTSVERSLKNLGTDYIDLVSWFCFLVLRRRVAEEANGGTLVLRPPLGQFNIHP